MFSFMSGKKPIVYSCPIRLEVWQFCPKLGSSERVCSVEGCGNHGCEWHLRSWAAWLQKSYFDRSIVMTIGASLTGGREHTLVCFNCIFDTFASLALWDDGVRIRIRRVVLNAISEEYKGY